MTSERHNPVFGFFGRIVVWTLCFCFAFVAGLAIWIAVVGDAEV